MDHPRPVRCSWCVMVDGMPERCILPAGDHSTHYTRLDRPTWPVVKDGSRWSVRGYHSGTGSVIRCKHAGHRWSLAAWWCALVTMPEQLPDFGWWSERVTDFDNVHRHGGWK